MVVRRRKKINRQLGERTRGNGDTKNRRGAGSRGGRGLAGSHKHKFSKYAGKFGKEKRKLLSRKETKALNIEQIVQAMPRLLQEGKAVKEEKAIVVDGKVIGFDKLLSRGTLGEKWIVRNVKASKKAVEKVEKAEGVFEEAFEAEEGKAFEGKEGPEVEDAKASKEAKAESVEEWEKEEKDNAEGKKKKEAREEKKESKKGKREKTLKQN
jgi:large subunit ribosomal protein L15